MFCAISGEPPKVPVVSKKSGLVYEQRLIHKYIDENEKDPITGESLQLDDLIEIKAKPKTVIPRPPSHTSVPSLLTSLQNEYDAIILEMFTLKKLYDNLRQELSHALYKNDASARVIARLMNERDQAREALANIQATIGAGGASISGSRTQDVEMAESEKSGSGALPASLVESIDRTAQKLSSQRKAKSKRKAPEGYATASNIGSFAELETIASLHNTKPAGVACMDVSADGNLLVTGGNDKNVLVHDRKENKTLATLKGHTKKITRVAFSGTLDPVIGADASSQEPTLPQYVVSASEDHTAKIWSRSEEESKSGAYSLQQTISSHKAEVTGLAIHPSGDFFATASRDATWSLHSITDGSLLLTVEAPSPSSESEQEAKGGYVYESFAFHPDGQLAATGTAEGTIRIWDVKTGQSVSTFHDQLQGKVSSLHFSENGYYLAAASVGSNLVEVWDLRKLTVSGTIQVEGAKKGIHSVRFDSSLQFLAVAESNIHVYANKSWNHLVTLQQSKQTTEVRWDNRNGNLLITGLDRSVKTFAPSS